MKIRGGSRVISIMLTKLGATPVGMPVPAVTDALSKGVIEGTTIPWEVVPALKVQRARQEPHHLCRQGRACTPRPSPSR
jgi:TRAP-type C4-dicarboxylate transport system substrate-binding protein